MKILKNIFSAPVKKKIENKDIEITYKVKFIDSYRFVSSSLLKLIDNLSEGLHNNKRLDCESCLDYMKTKNEKLILKCFHCKQNYEKDFNKEPIKTFASTYEFCNGNLNKFILLLRKGTNIWIIAKDLMKNHYLIKSLFIVI